MKDNPAKITFHKCAIVALDALSIEDKKPVLKCINYLSILEIELDFEEKLKECC